MIFITKLGVYFKDIDIRRRNSTTRTNDKATIQEDGGNKRNRITTPPEQAKEQ
jgi:hypothetical protein